MATSYDPTLAKPLDRARLALGDRGQVVGADGAQIYLLPDETIDALIASLGYAEGVAQCADTLAVEAAQLPDVYEEASGAKVQWNERVGAWRDLATRLRSSGSGAGTASGGVRGGATLGPDLSGLYGLRSDPFRIVS